MKLQEFKNDNPFINAERANKILKILSITFQGNEPKDIVAKKLHNLDYDPKKTAIFALGKAAESMSNGLRETKFRSSKLKIVIAPFDINSLDKDFRIYRGNHPVPLTDSYKSTREIIRILQNAEEENLIVLLSGGASSLFELPENGIEDQTFSDITKCLLDAGTDIESFNALRCGISSIKCGKILPKLKFNKYKILLISDVPSNELYLIGSNPFAVHKFDFDNIKSSCLPENINFTTNSNAQQYTHKTSMELILSGNMFADSLSGNIKSNYISEEVVDLGQILMGDIKIISAKLPQLLRKIFSEKGKPFWFIGFGESTAEVRGSGKGGRNTELSMRIMMEMNENEIFSVMSVATDGDDGNSGLMGMVADNCLKRKTSHEDFKYFLDSSDSAGFARKYSVQVESGFTGTNVSDIIIGYYGGINESITG